MKEKLSPKNESGSDLDLPFEKLNVSYDNDGENSQIATSLKSADCQHHKHCSETSTKDTSLIHQKR